MFMEWHRNEVRMGSEWNKRLLSLIKRQHPFISFRPHSTHSSSFCHFNIIQDIFWCRCLWNDIGMRSEWGLNEINGCCLGYRDSTRLFHSDLIWFIPQSFCHLNIIVCLFVTDTDIHIFGMTEEWGRMGSGWNKRVLSLIKRQHPFISFRPHSTHSSIILSFQYHSRQLLMSTNMEWD